MAIYSVLHNAYDGDGNLQAEHVVIDLQIIPKSPAFGNIREEAQKQLEDYYLNEFGKGSEGGDPKVDIIELWRKTKRNEERFKGRK